MCNDAMPIDESAEIDALLDYACPPDEERHSICPGVNLHFTARQEWEHCWVELDMCSEISACERDSAIEREWRENQHKLDAARRNSRLSPDLLPDLRRAASALEELKREPVAALLARIARDSANAVAAGRQAAVETALAAQAKPANTDPQACGLATICIEPRIIAQRPIAARVCAGMLH